MRVCSGDGIAAITAQGKGRGISMTSVLLQRLLPMVGSRQGMEQAPVIARREVHVYHPPGHASAAPPRFSLCARFASAFLPLRSGVRACP